MSTAAKRLRLPIPLLDRAVAERFLSNFVLLFALLFVFAISVDVIVQAERFLDAASIAVEEGRSASKLGAVIWILLDFHGPRVFQFYQYMLGLVSIGAMGFTFAQMHRTRELTAVMAAGVSLRRLALAVLLAAVGLNLLQGINQEFILPKLAPRLVRDHGDLMRPGGQTFEVPLTLDGDTNLLSARSFDPATGEIDDLLFLDRTATGMAKRRITAKHAIYDGQRRGWVLEGGTAVERGPGPDGQAAGDDSFLEPIDFIESALTPQAIVVRRFRLYAQMLDMQQVRVLEHEGGTDQATVIRLMLGRFAGPCANLLVLAISIPFFLLREPRLLLAQSVKAAAISVPAMLGALVFLTVPFSDLSGAVSVAIPVALLLPIAAWRIAYLRT